MEGFKKKWLFVGVIARIGKRSEPELDLACKRGAAGAIISKRSEPEPE